MTPKELFNVIENDPELTGVCLLEDGMVISYSGNEITTKVSFEDVKKLDEKTAVEVLKTAKDTNPLRVMTRVCGYYSLVNNWNESKKVERLDRHKGNYTISE